MTRPGRQGGFARLGAAALALVLVAPGPPAPAASCATRAYPISQASDARLVAPVFPQAVTGAGDVNSDGYDDFIVLYSNIGEGLIAQVIYGAPVIPPVIPAQGAAYGFPILTPRSVPPEEGIWSIGAAGDFNKDGYSDLIVGAPYTSRTGRYSGTAYVVFGSAAPAPVTLGALDLLPQGLIGVQIKGSGPDWMAGMFVDGIGDQNDDGYDDVIVSAPGSGAHAAYVVYGRASTAPVNLADLHTPGEQGYRIKTAEYRYNGRAAARVNGLGDVNGDGVEDVSVGVDPRFPDDQASGTHVVFGSIQPRDIDSTRAKRLVLLGGTLQVDSAGDFDDDGKTDILSFGHLAFGRKRPGLIPYERQRWIVHDDGNEAVHSAGTGDVNGDGYDDVVIGDWLSTRNGYYSAGAAYVVLGGPRRSLRLSCLGARGVRYDGELPQGVGYAVGIIGDINSDGYDDVAISDVLAPGLHIVLGGEEL
jgi:hypothetical protein